MQITKFKLKSTLVTNNGTNLYGVDLEPGTKFLITSIHRKVDTMTALPEIIPHYGLRILTGQYQHQFFWATYYDIDNDLELDTGSYLESTRNKIKDAKN